jgi:glutamyl-tRNA synthetase
MGYLPEALRNYLLRLGWSHGDAEIIATDQAIQWFDLAGIGRAPAQFDFAKLDSINAHYIREADDARLVALVAERLEAEFGRSLSETERGRLLKAMPGLKPRAKTIVEMVGKAKALMEWLRIPRNERAITLLEQDQGSHFPVISGTGASNSPGGRLPQIRAVLESIPPNEWPNDALTPTRLSGPLRDLATTLKISFGIIAQLLGAAVYGSPETPGLYVVLDVLGRDEVLRRIEDAFSDPTGKAIP